jgi:type IV pilus assembly protein PilO
MTTTGDFIPGDSNLDAGSTYPVVFGITLTPLVSGVLLALAGIAGAAYIVINFVQPAFTKNQELSKKVEEKNNQLSQLEVVKKQIKDAEANLEKTKKQQSDVLTLFANESTLNTVLLDINRQISDRATGVAKARQEKLANCPAWVRNNVTEIEKQAGKLVIDPKLTKFEPDPKNSGVITDGSYGPLVNNNLKRQSANVSFVGNFNQTQSILRSLERLQPLMVFKNMQFKLTREGSETSGGSLFELQQNLTPRYLPNCQPEPQITTSFQIEALVPLSTEAIAAATQAAQTVKK